MGWSHLQDNSYVTFLPVNFSQLLCLLYLRPLQITIGTMGISYQIDQDFPQLHSWSILPWKTDNQKGRKSSLNIVTSQMQEICTANYS